MNAVAGSNGPETGPEGAGSAPSRPRFTRRHWAREVRSYVVGTYLDLTGMFRGASGKFSQFRLILAVVVVQYSRHWPGEWNGDAVAALAILVFALPVDALFARVPVTEALGALQAFFGAIAGKATEMYTRYRSQAVSYEAGAYVDPPPRASDGAVG